MKKLLFVMLAATLAIGFSAFTPKKTALVYFFPNSTIGWKSENLDPCPSGPVQQCIVPTTNYGDQQIYQSAGGPAYTSEME